MAELSPAAAGDAVARLLAAAGPILSLDIGSGTQDVLLALPGERAENWPRFVLPSPALGIADRIRRHTAAGRPVWLYGHNMGGGFAVAVQEQVAAGLAPAASPDAALALHDNPERVKAQGVSITPSCPKGYAAVPLADYEPGFWDGLLSAAGLPKPSLVVAAAQDHGHHPEGNRVGRFNLWRALLTETQGDPARWLYDTSPAPCTRLNALQRCTGGPVADTATAAVLGALAAPEVAKRSQRQGVTVVNWATAMLRRSSSSRGAFSASMSTTPGCWIPTPCCSISRNSVSAGFPTNRCAPKAGTAARSLRLCLLKRKALPRPSRSGRAARCCWGTPNSSPRTAT